MWLIGTHEKLLNDLGIVLSLLEKLIYIVRLRNYNPKLYLNIFYLLIFNFTYYKS